MFVVDQNLPPSLCVLLRDVGPADHVRDLGLSQSDDTAIWRYCVERDHVIVTKDDDFQELAMLSGDRQAPRVIWVRIGNCSIGELHLAIESTRADIRRFIEQRSAAVFIIRGA